jgi:RNA polymerase sigma factor (sigma-70 family)
LTGPLSGFLRHFRRQVVLHNTGETTDGDLLQRFARGADGDAFAALVQRHGPLVLGVCRRVLRQEQDAEDAFQATFLVLARKAGSIGQPEQLGNWLYGVASRVARKARADAARKRAREHRAADAPTRQPAHEADGEDLRQVLDDEVRRLPDRFRAPFVLCCLQDLTREEAAARLGWSAGAVKGMLERGRELLRSRLVRRGVALSAGSLAAILSGNALSAAAPAALSDSTVKAALAFAAGKLATAGGAAGLAEGVLQAMWMTRVKAWSAAALVLGLAVTGAGVLAFGGRPAEEPKKADPAPEEVGKADQLRRLAEGRLDAARTAYKGYWARFEAGVGREEAVHLWSRRWLQAQLDLSDKKAARDAALAAYQERLKKTDELARARLVLGNSPEGDHDRFGQKKFEEVEEANRDADIRAEFGDAPKMKRKHGEELYFEIIWKAYEHSEVNEEQVCLASVRWLMDRHRARKIIKEIDPKTELQAHLERIKKVEKIAGARFEAGKTAMQDYKTATFFRLQAEEWLAQGKTFKANDEDPDASSK